MERTQKLTMADVAGWGSALVTFGLIQGAFYLKAYWGHFGLDPFQFVAVSELALAGLAGIGMVLFFILIALLLGGWVEGKVTATPSQANLLMWLTLALCLVGMGALLWWTNAWPVLIGVALTGIDGHMCNGSTPVPSVAGRREGLAVAGLCARDDCLCPDLVKLAWLRARQGDYFWRQQVHGQCDY
ncbi:hypothetical protein [Stenotrophomonas maltophilia]|uniref:hypothetical protein n=1 Tax=Stenotrophomonas maltophilia TaxID=40324 RepID=UPI000DA720C6|nr:hypothetical protein [Stenotrophomonas maltophilia]